MADYDANAKNRRRDRYGRFADENNVRLPDGISDPSLSETLQTHGASISEDSALLDSLHSGDSPTYTFGNDNGEMTTICREGTGTFGVTELGRDFPENVVAIHDGKQINFFPQEQVDGIDAGIQEERTCMDAVQSPSACETEPGNVREQLSDLHVQYMNSVVDYGYAENDSAMRVLASVNQGTNRLDIAPGWNLYGDWPNGQLNSLSRTHHMFEDDNHPEPVSIQPAALDRFVGHLNPKQPLLVGMSSGAIHFAQDSETNKHAPTTIWCSMRSLFNGES